MANDAPQGPTIAPVDVDEHDTGAEESFERWRRVAGVILSPIVFFVTFFWTRHASHLSYEGQMMSAVLAAVAVLWLTETIPLPVTALLGAVLCIVFGVAPARTVLAPFADPFIFLFMGSFILARSMAVHGLDRRIALGFLSLPGIGNSPARVLAGVGAVCALLSMWVSNTATAAMMLPIALGILTALHTVRVKRGLASGPMNARAWPYATGMMLMVAYGASIGGIGTPVGSPPNLIGIGRLRDQAKIEIGFAQWMMLMVPMLLVMSGVLFVLLYALHPQPAGKAARGHFKSRDPDGAKESKGAAFANDDLSSAPLPDGRGSSDASTPSAGDDGSGEMKTYLRSELHRLGPWSRGQVNTLIAFSVAVLLWVTPGLLPLFELDKIPWVKLAASRVPEAVAAMVAAILLFVLPVNLSRGEFTLNWREASKIDWGTLLLFGGGLSLGGLMDSTGVAAALGWVAQAQVGGQSVWMLTAAAIVLGVFLSELTSNTAAATMIVPVVIQLAISNGVSPVPPVLGAVLGASYGFMLPVSTPPNAIVYGSGLVSIPRMVRAGILFDIIGAVVIWCGLRLLCPLFGWG